MQERHNSIANALELSLSCTNPSIYKQLLYRIINHIAVDVLRYISYHGSLYSYTLAPGNPTLWRGVPVAPIQKSFGSSGWDWKPGKILPIPCKFFTYRFFRCSSTCYGMVRIDPLMANIRNPDFFASLGVVNTAWFDVVLPCYLNRDLLSGPKGN